MKERKRGRPPHADVLTPAEWRVVHAVQHGLTNQAIARRRGISVDAVKFHVANAVAKLGLRNRAALRDWFRAPAHTALHREERTMTAMPALGKLHQIARTVRDVAASEAWYRDTLGLRHLFTFGSLAFFDLDGTRLMLSADGALQAESLLYLRVADIRAAHEALVARGVRFDAPPHLIHRHADGSEEWLAVFFDLEERPLALMAQVRP
ncbi:MAG: VOC family protein [Gammaproteobacteria bacterium]|nr:VOC family protein [Gammaproteobacteria bacterium]